MHIFNEETIMQICLERDRLLASDTFVRAPVMGTLLRYLVDQKLAGTDGNINADTIAIEALGRNDDFDSSADSYPRVQIGRLRKLLDRTYSKNPDGVRFKIPMGDYRIVLDETNKTNTDLIGKSVVQTATPVESVRNPEPTDSIINTDAVLYAAHNANDLKGELNTETSEQIAATLSYHNHKSIDGLKKRQALILIMMISIMAIAALWVFGFKPGGAGNRSSAFVEAPVLLVENVHSESDEGAGLATQTNALWADSFRRFDTLQLRTSAAKKQSNSASYRLQSKILDMDNSYSLSVRLYNREKQLIWSKVADINSGTDSLDIEVSKIIAQLSPLDGVIGQDFVRQIDNKYAPGYPCLVRYQNYMRYRRTEMLPKISDCLNKSIELAEKPATYLAALSFVTFITNSEAGADAGQGKGAELARRAMMSNPRNATAVFSGARTAFFAGNCRRGKILAQRATKLNPYDPEIISFTGAYLFGCTDKDAENYLRLAMSLRPNQNTTSPIALAFLLVREERNEEAMEVIDNIVVQPGVSEPQYELVRTLAHAKQGNRIQSQKIWQKLAADYKIPGNSNPKLILENFITSPSIIDEAVIILKQEKIVS